VDRDAFALVPRPRQFLLKIHDLFDRHQKSAVHFREVENLPDGEAVGGARKGKSANSGLGRKRSERHVFATARRRYGDDVSPKKPGVTSSGTFNRLERSCPFKSFDRTSGSGKWMLVRSILDFEDRNRTSRHNHRWFDCSFWNLSRDV
jgi:hypothetical protein